MSVESRKIYQDLTITQPGETQFSQRQTCSLTNSSLQAPRWTWRRRLNLTGTSAYGNIQAVRPGMQVFRLSAKAAMGWEII